MSQSDQFSFEPAAIHDVAAHLFGYMTANYDHRSALMQVVNSNGLCLFDQEFSEPFLTQYGFYNLSPLAQSVFQSKVADEVIRYADNGKAMPGLICYEDAVNARSVISMPLDLSHLNNQPIRMVRDEAIKTLGRLCMRHPLPGVVFTEQVPTGKLIQVADTVEALGFQMSMWLSDFSVEKLTDSLYVLQGMFHIPVPNEEVGDQWSHAIQNSVRFVSKCRMYDGGKKYIVTAVWPSN